MIDRVNHIERVLLSKVLIVEVHERFDTLEEVDVRDGGLAEEQTVHCAQLIVHSEKN